MKNMKRLIALASAFAITMSMGVSAFAEYDTATYDPETNVVALSDDANVTGAVGTSITMADGEEYTVIIISEADQNNVTADSLYYLNQGTSAEGFWATNGMGIRLADGTTELAEGNYIVRIGDKAGNIVEIEFAVGADGEVIDITFGDANADGLANNSDVTALLVKIAGGKADYTDADTNTTYTIGKSYGDITFGDANADGLANNSDVTALLVKIAGGKADYTDADTNKTYTIGKSYTVTVTE